MKFIAILGITACGAVAFPTARFDATDLIIKDGIHSLRLPNVIDPNAFFQTIHAIQQRGRDFFVVYGTSEMSRGWPPRSGNCGCGTESYVRWLHIREGKIMAQQEGRYESCFMNRGGWVSNWREGKLVWSSSGIEREGESEPANYITFDYTWNYDPRHPERGISEVKTPHKSPTDSPKGAKVRTD